MRVTQQTLARLKELHAKGYHLREQLEAVAAECCTLMGVDPESMSIEADLCREIVDHGADPERVLKRLPPKPEK